MNESDRPDDLSAGLERLGHELERPPRRDARVERLLGASPPVAGGADAEVTDVIPLPIGDPAPKRRTAWIAVAAALALLAGVGLAAYAVGGDDPVLPTAADGAEPDDESDAPAGDDDAEPDAEPDADPAADDAEPESESAPDPAPDGDLDDAHAWLECVTGEFGAIFGHGTEERGDVPSFDECGDPPAIGEMFPGFDTLPDFDELPEEWWPPGLGDWTELDEWCTSASTDAGVEIECAWPPCPDDVDCPFPPACPTEVDGDDPHGCFGFDFGFGIEIDPEGFGFRVPFGGEGSFFLDPGILPDTFPELPDDFEFPQDLSELDEWFERFPWADDLEGFFEPLEPADA